MNTLLGNLLIVAQIVSAVAMVVLILLQQGQGASMGAAFGAGSSGSLFGATGSANFLSRSTAVLATIFFASTLAMAYLGMASFGAAVESGGGSVLERSLIQLPVESREAPALSGDDENAAGQIPADTLESESWEALEELPEASAPGDAADDSSASQIPGN